MKKLLCIIGLCLIYSCGTNSFDTREELIDYIKDQDHGYKFNKSVNGYQFSLLYKPTDLLIMQELSPELSEAKRVEEIKELREKYSKNMYFSLSISKKGEEVLSAAPTNRMEFSSMVKQLAFDMNEKVHLFSEQKDTLQMLDYIYPRMYGTSTSTDMLIIYPRDEVFLGGENFYITIEDIGLYTGEIKFKLPAKNIIHEPKLKNL